MHLLMCSVNLSGSFFSRFSSCYFFLFSFFLIFFVSFFVFLIFLLFSQFFFFSEKNLLLLIFDFLSPFSLFTFPCFAFFFLFHVPFFFFFFLFIFPFLIFFFKKILVALPLCQSSVGMAAVHWNPQLSSPPLPFSPRPAGRWKPIKQPKAFSRPGRVPLILIATVQARTAMNITSQ